MFTSKLQTGGRSRLSISTDNAFKAISSKKQATDFNNLNLSARFRGNRHTSDGLNLQPFGGTLPVSATEVLRFKKNVIGGFGPNSLVYIISDRQLIVWNWSDDSSRKIPKNYTLQLPPTSSRFTTGNIYFYVAESSIVSCIVVAKEGYVRYWNNITHETSFSETIIDNRRHECILIIPFQNRLDSCCVVSQQGELILLSIGNPNSGIQWRLVKFASGLLSGIGRRMSSLFFATSGQTSLGDVKCACVGEVADGIESIYLICGATLQKCVFSELDESIVFQCPVEAFFLERLADTIWKQSVSHTSGIRICLLDMKCTKNGLFVLGCGVNLQVDATCHFAIGMLHPEGKIPPQSFLSFFVVPVKTLYTESDKFGDALSYKLLLDDKSNAFVYSKSSVVCLSLNNPTENTFSIDFSPTDQMIGFGFANKYPAVFSLSHGLQRLQETSQINDHSYHDVSTLSQAKDYDVSVALASVTQDKLLELTMSEDELSQFKAAFLNFTSKNLPNAFAVVDELFPSDFKTRTESSLLDGLTARLSKEILDDYPAKDPRWAKMLPAGSAFSTASLILMHQLDDKARVHTIFVEFLKAMNLVNRLGVIDLRGTHVPTSILLGEQAEKIAAARALVELQVQHAKVVDTAINRLVVSRHGSPPLASGLTEQDVFFREVSRFDEIISALTDIEFELRGQNMTVAEQVGVVKSVNAVIIGIVAAVNQCRQENRTDSIQATQPHGPGIEYVPWFCPVEEQTGKFLLLKQHTLTCSCVTSEATNSTEIDLLFQQLVVVTDIILETYNSWLEWRIKQQPNNEMSEKTIQLQHEFEEQKRQLLQPFLKGKHYEQSAALAEKYCEFNTLMEICEATDNQDRLQKYMNQFQGRGFGEFVCKWYSDRGMRGHLLGARFINQPSLKNFLRSSENRFMGWLHDIDVQDYYGAHKSLLEQACKETQYLAKKETLLALSKLAALASDRAANDLEVSLNAIQREQDLVLQQKQLPAVVIDALAMEKESMHVLSVTELIECYISNDINPTANEDAFKKALDLTYFIDDSKRDVRELRLHIWSQAALRDDWQLSGNNDPIVVCKNTTFFKTVAQCDDRSLVPSVEELLLSDELVKLREESTFEFLLKAGFEYIKRQL